MKAFKLFIFFSFTFLLASDSLKDEYSFAFTVHKYNKVEQNKLKSVVFQSAKKYEELFNGKYEVNVHFPENEEKILDHYINFRKYNIIIIDSDLYIKRIEDIKKSSQALLLIDIKNDFQSYLLIASKSSKIKKLEDIKGKVFAKYIGNKTFSNWLDYLTLKELKTPYSKLIKEETTHSKDNRLVLDLFFNKADFTVVRKSVYEDMLLLNPSISKNVRVIRESKPIFVYGMGLFNKNMSEELINDFFTVLHSEEYDAKFKPLFSLVDRANVKKYEFEHLKEFEDFYKEYKHLKKSYK